MADASKTSNPAIAQLEYARSVRERRPLLPGWMLVGVLSSVLAGTGPIALGIVMTKPVQGPDLPDPTNALVGCGLSLTFSVLIAFYAMVLWWKPSSDRQYRTGLGILLGYGLQVGAVFALIVYLFLRNFWQSLY